jgi:NADH:ubiquinone oxidoreductase subunit 2 (subunit N)
VNPFHARLAALPTDTLASLALFGPELALCATVVLMLLLRVMFGRRLPTTGLAAAGVLVATAAAIALCCDPTLGRREVFSGLLVVDPMTVFFRIFLCGFAVLFVVFTWRSGIPDRDDAADFYTLALGSLVGMCLMASSNHLLMLFLSIEMASVPSYALAGILKGRRVSSEAALKFSVYGAGTAGVMLYGISLLAGITGSVHLPTLAHRLADLLAVGAAPQTQMVLALGGLMVMVGLAFKLSAVPFHFWAPDVFEGAAAEVGGFLSVASKAAALAILLRVASVLGFPPAEAAAVGPLQQAEAPASAGEQFVSADARWPAQVAGHAAPHSPQSGPATPTHAASDAPAAELHDALAQGAYVSAAAAHDAQADRAATHAADAHGADDAHAAAPPAQIGPQQRQAALRTVRHYMAYLIGLLAAITCTFGNLAAYGQNNIKRLLAYSTIAHAGYMMLPVSAFLLLEGSAAQEAAAAVTLYVALYLFMNLTAFAIVAFLRNQLRSEQIDAYAGLIRKAPGVVICFSLVLLSLIGLPPLAGFVAKFAAFAALAHAGLILLLLIGCLNTALSLFYYLRVMKAMILDPPVDGSPDIRLPLLRSFDGALIAVLSLPLLVLGLLWQPMHLWALDAVQRLLG